MNLPRRAVVSSLTTLALAGAAFAAGAQAAWPTRPITLVVPYSAGGSLGFAKVMQAASDGHTFLMAGDSPLNPNAPPGGPYYKVDVLKELQPVVLVNTAPMVLVAQPALAANSLGELIALAKKQPGKLSYATSGIGTLPHLATEMIKQVAQIHMVHIPYRGGSQIANDVAGNQVELAMLIAASAAPYVQSKTVKALAVTSDKRLALLPGVPAAAETPGFKGFNVVSWAGLYAPARVPAAVVNRMNQEVDEVLKTAAVREALAKAGAVPGGGSPAAFASFIQQDRAKIAKVLQVTSLRE